LRRQCTAAARVFIARLPPMAAPSQRRALGALFLLLTAMLAGITYAAYRADQWVIVVTAGVLAAWMASLVLRSWRAG
jgi:hypothetical protein